MIRVLKFFENTSLFSMRKLYISFCSILFCSSIYGQTSLKGKVIDESGDPLIGVHVSVKSSSEGTITDADGDFVFTTKKTFPVTLLVSYIGYEKLEIVVSDAKTLRIVLKEDVLALGEVVVLGIGY
ncbi:MAG: carboxypeptidase-like regulatory domain-containing protein, partial [Tannerella sp.]|nr:carboxypeptidase-like regulatory domain-containing protein [Tannerella sp.]